MLHVCNGLPILMLWRGWIDMNQHCSAEVTPRRLLFPLWDKESEKKRRKNEIDSEWTNYFDTASENLIQIRKKSFKKKIKWAVPERNLMHLKPKSCPCSVLLKVFIMKNCNILPAWRQRLPQMSLSIYLCTWIAITEFRCCCTVYRCCSVSHFEGG